MTVLNFFSLVLSNTQAAHKPLSDSLFYLLLQCQDSPSFVIDRL